MAVDAVIYFRIKNATASIVNVNNAQASTRLLAATTLRNVLGTKTMAEILSDREHISQTMQVMQNAPLLSSWVFSQFGQAIVYFVNCFFIASVGNCEVCTTATTQVVIIF